MQSTRVQPYPVPKTILMRCVLFALSRMGARLHQYSEQDGVIIASAGKYRVGQKELVRREVKAAVQEVEYATQLRVSAPGEVADELLELVSLYAGQGAQAVRGDAVAQWDRFIKSEEGARKRADQRQKLQQRLDSVKGLLSDFIGADFEEAPEPAGIDDIPSVPDKASGDEIALTTVDGDGTSIIAIDPSAHDLKLPENPGMLVQDRHMQTMEVRIDPGLFPDRSRYLKICRNCSAVNLHTGLFCSQCGQALVLEAAVKGELGSGIQAHASAGLRYGIFGLLPILAFFAITAAPFAVAGGAISLSSMVEILTRSLSSIGNTIGQGVVMATVPLMLLIALPSFLFGRKAVTESQKAIHHLNLNFVLEKTGRRRAAWGNALGWFDTYAGITFLVLVVMASLMK
ncbi:MAG: hypothetical protein WBK62_01155 [Candidatus Fermentibacter daniensis]